MVGDQIPLLGIAFQGDRHPTTQVNSVAKQAIILQHVEDDPRNAGWWRYSRPVFRHVTQLPDSQYVRWNFGTNSECRKAQKDWDKEYVVSN